MTGALKIMPVEQCGAIGKCMGHPSSYENACTYNGRKPSMQSVATHALQQLELARAKDLEAHERNLPALANNQAVASHVTAVMTATGMPLKWSERDRSSRSRYSKSLTHEAGWITDLRRECKTDDGFATATSTYEALKARYQEYAEQGKREAQKAEETRQREKEAALDKRKADMALATILLRYELPLESSWGEVLDALAGRDQRLQLAVAMQRTRLDWSDGPCRVIGALRAFKIETDEDKNIAACVAGCLVDFDDGRVFRDCEWNYGALFASVADQQLSTDVQAALAQVESE